MEPVARDALAREPIDGRDGPPLDGDAQHRDRTARQHAEAARPGQDAGHAAATLPGPPAGASFGTLVIASIMSGILGPMRMLA